MLLHSFSVDETQILSKFGHKSVKRTACSSTKKCMKSTKNIAGLVILSPLPKIFSCQTILMKKFFQNFQKALNFLLFCTPVWACCCECVVRRQRHSQRHLFLRSMHQLRLTKKLYAS